ncbi:MAG TPA: 5'-3' exonuclease H3TH domain-containing protein [Myxococcaceae bacterium]|nr:5'-3' exonuclease H3TH domain-containing protein [Myxococcaceae bacterium]
MRLHLVDGTYELFRAHFSRRPSHQGPDGMPLKATVQLVSSLLALLADPGERPTHLAVAFDNPIRSFRNDLFDGYKTEEGVPEELLAQFDVAELATRALGIVVWSMREFEADDALASGAARFASQVEQVRILTPDKDLGQCLRGNQVVQVDRMRGKLVDEPALRALRGIGPESIPDWLALVGDTADGIPGLPGFGEKGAAAVLAAFQHIEQIPADARAWPDSIRGRDTLARTLAEHRKEALLFRTLATLRTDAPIDTSLAALEHRGVPREPFELFARRVDSPGLLSRVARWAA